jgi:hypothetical protein
MGVKCCNAFGRSCLDHRRPAPPQRLLEQARQHRFEVLPLQMVEKDLGHRF